MTTAVPDLPENEPESLADNLAGMGSFFIDPGGAARRLPRKWFWIGPVVVISIVSLAVGFMMRPVVQHVLEAAPPPPNVSPEQYQRSMAIGIAIQRIATFFSPILVIVTLLIESGIILATCSVISVRAKFRSILNMVAGCGLITALASMATVIIVRAKGEVSTMAELRPSLGLDLFLPDGTNKYLMATLGYFSVFTLWWIVMLVLVFSAGFRVSKGKAVAAILPLVVLSLLLTLSGAIFQR